MYPVNSKLHEQLQSRAKKGLHRKLKNNSKNLIDFFSNDYLGLVHYGIIKAKMANGGDLPSGSTGSRLLGGNSVRTELLEKRIAEFHYAESALLYNSGYDANLGFLSCIPQKGDFIFYDELSHASIIDGLSVSYAKPIKFLHNDLNDLEKKIKLQALHDQNVFVITESVYSMDGDAAPLKELSDFCNKNHFHLVVDEAHAVGVFGINGEGKCVEKSIEHSCYARIVTYGKAFGVHGAAICGDSILTDYLINFSRPFIYSTSLPAHTVESLHHAYHIMNVEGRELRKKLFENISYFNQRFQHVQGYQKSQTPIQTIIIPGNEQVDKISKYLIDKGFDIRPIKSPTVRAGKERLRICLHSFNTHEEINNLFLALSEASLHN